MKSFKYDFLFLVAFCQCDWFTFLMRTEHRLVAVQFVNKIYIYLLQLELHANVLD